MKFHTALGNVNTSKGAKSEYLKFHLNAGRRSASAAANYVKCALFWRAKKRLYLSVQKIQKQVVCRKHHRYFQKNARHEKCQACLCVHFFTIKVLCKHKILILDVNYFFSILISIILLLFKII